MKNLLNKLEGLITTIIAGTLWRLGGSDICPKAVRRYGIAGVMVYLVLRRTKNWIVAVISGIILFLATTIGYGIPDAGDGGSSLGRAITSLGFEGTNLVFAVRLIVGLLYSLSYLPTIIYNINRDGDKQVVQGIIGMLLTATLIPCICIIQPGAVIEEFLIGSTIIGIYALITRSK